MMQNMYNICWRCLWFCMSFQVALREDCSANLTYVEFWIIIISFRVISILRSTCFGVSVPKYIEFHHILHVSSVNTYKLHLIFLPFQYAIPISSSFCWLLKFTLRHYQNIVYWNGIGMWVCLCGRSTTKLGHHWGTTLTLWNEMFEYTVNVFGLYVFFT